MLATVPSSGATTGISIFIASTTTTASPFFTACPTLASILNTLPAAPASTLMLPAPAALAAGAAAGAALGAALGAAGAATGANLKTYQPSKLRNKGLYHLSYNLPEKAVSKAL